MIGCRLLSVSEQFSKNFLAADEERRWCSLRTVMLQERPGQARGGAGSAQANNVRRVASINTEAANMKER